MGVGFLGKYVAKFLKKLNYNVIGFKNRKTKKNFGFPIYLNNQINKFINSSNIIIAILPSSKATTNFIDKKFLSKMKKNSLLINVGRGITLNEEHLIQHLKTNKNFFTN